MELSFRAEPYDIYRILSLQNQLPFWCGSGSLQPGDCMLTKLLRTGLLTAACWGLGTGLAAAACKMQAVLVMPITMSGPQPLVTVKLDGTEVHLLMDTGSFFSFVSPEAAKRAGLNVGLAPDNLRVQGTGGSARPDEARVKDFTIGSQTLHHVDLLVYGDRLSNGGVDGILGQNFLRLADIEIDLANGVARLIRATDCEHANLAYWAGSSPVSDLDILSTETNAPHVIGDAAVDGTHIRVMFDSGASTSILSLHAAQEAGITPQSAGVVPGGLRYGVGSATRDSWIAPFKSFKLASEETRNTHLRIGDIGLMPRDVDMLLGADFFLSHHVLISYGQRKVFFTYNGGPVFDLSVRAAVAGPPADSSAPAASATGNAGDLDRRGEASVARGDLPGAISEFGLAIAAEPTNPLYYLHRAQALLRSGNPAAAVSDLDQALRLQPGLTDALMLRASIRIRTNNLDGARADFAAAEASAPGRLELPLQEAAIYTATARYPMALEVLDHWIDAHPQDERRADALGERCLVRGMMGKDLDAALADCNTARRNASGNSQILYNRGIVQLRRREFAKAISDFNDVIELQPRLARAIYARGLARIAKGDKSAGEADLQSALAMDPQVARLFRDVDLGS
jgi:tetratricopeptide (TPR) repeat protein/predicted aspartyl protease